MRSVMISVSPSLRLLDITPFMVGYELRSWFSLYRLSVINLYLWVFMAQNVESKRLDNLSLYEISATFFL